MHYLRAPVEQINALIATRLKGTHLLHGIVRQVRREKEKGFELINFDEKGQPVGIDDRYATVVYHRLNRITAEVEGGRGKHTLYQLKAEMSLICSARQEVVHDLLLLILASHQAVEYQGSDFDFNKIIRAETGPSGVESTAVNFQHRLFRMDYTLSQLSSRCLDACAVNQLLTADSANDYIETNQGSGLSAQ